MLVDKLPNQALILTEGGDIILFEPKGKHKQRLIEEDEAKSILFDALRLGKLVMPGYKSEHGIHIDIFNDIADMQKRAEDHYGITLHNKNMH